MYILGVQAEPTANGEVGELVLRALPVYLGVPLAGFLLYGLLSRGNLVRAALRPFAGYSAGLAAMAVAVFFFISRFEVPFGLFDVLMGGFGSRPLLALLFLILSHVGSLVVGLLAALIAGRFELLVAALSVWAGATLGYKAVTCRVLSYTLEGACWPFDPFDFIFDFVGAVSYLVLALIGGVIAARFAAR
jgi:hypothetical protein